jgi:hypothetical protein
VTGKVGVAVCPGVGTDDGNVIGNAGLATSGVVTAAGFDGSVTGKVGVAVCPGFGTDDGNVIGNAGYTTGVVTTSGFEGMMMPVGVDELPPPVVDGTVDGAEGRLNGRGLVVAAGVTAGVVAAGSGRFLGTVGVVTGAIAGTPKSIVIGSVKLGTPCSLLLPSANLCFHIPSPTVYLTSFSS